LELFNGALRRPNFRYVLGVPSKWQKEIQEVIKEARKDTTEIKLWRLPEAQHWQDFTVVTVADQHANRPCGGSTGGLITFLGGTTTSTR